MSMDRTTPLKTAFEQWVSDRVMEQNLAPSSAPSYLRHCRSLVAITGDVQVDRVTYADAKRWHHSMGGLSKSTVSNRISVMSTFFGWLVRESVLEFNPMDRLTRPRLSPNPPRPAPGATTQRIIDTATPKARLMVKLASQIGLRRFEIAKLQRCDFGFEDETLFIIGKGGKKATISVPSGLLAEVRAWCDANYVQPKGYLFPSPSDRSKPLTAKRVGDIITEASWIVGEHVTPHTYRHLAATRMVNEAGIKAAQVLLRHSSSATTDIYAQQDKTMVKAALDRLYDDPAA